MKKLASLSLLVVLSAALVVAGCGSSDDSSDSSSASAPSKAEFVKEGNTICAAGNKTIDAGAGALNGSSSQSAVTAFVTKTVIPAVELQVEGIEGLTPPEGDEDEVAAIVSAANEGLEKVKADPGAVTSGDPFAEANKLSKDYGLTVCAG